MCSDEKRSRFSSHFQLLRRQKLRRFCTFLTNVISITDGQIYFPSKPPAVDVALHPALEADACVKAQVAGTLRLDLCYREKQAFS